MIEPVSAPASPSYWDYATTRPSCAAGGVDPATDADPEQSPQWQGPGGFTLEFYETNFRGGGGSRLCLRSPDGAQCWVEGVHLEIVEPERMVFAGRLGIESDCFPGMADTVTFRRA